MRLLKYEPICQDLKKTLGKKHSLGFLNQRKNSLTSKENSEQTKSDGSFTVSYIRSSYIYIYIDITQNKIKFNINYANLK